MALLGGGPEPFDRFRKVLVDALPLPASQAQLELRFRMPLAGGIAEPFCSSGQVLLHTFTVGVCHAHGILVLLITILCVACARLNNRFGFHLAE